jgi:hypothetical protein
MSEFKLVSDSLEVAVVTDADRRERLDWITSQCYARLNIWDRDFVCDQSDRVHFTGSQRDEIDRLWRRWKGYC